MQPDSHEKWGRHFYSFNKKCNGYFYINWGSRKEEEESRLIKVEKSLIRRSFWDTEQKKLDMMGAVTVSAARIRGKLRKIQM